MPNTALAWLSLWFVKHWDDRRLARHCHYIGLPLSIAACVWSGFEPLAALICLSGYAILYLLAIWVFAAPWVTYLAAAAVAGACYFGTRLVPGITAGRSGPGGGRARFCLLGGARRAAPAACATAVSRSLAAGRAGPHGRGDVRRNCAPRVRGGWLVDRGGAFVVISALAFLLNRERPRAIWAQLVLLSFVEFTICGLGLALGIQNLGRPPLRSALHGGRTGHAGGG